MTKATEMARVSAKGGFHLLWGLVVSTIISAVGTIIIAGLLGPENMGLYYIAVGAPNLIANFRDWGVNTAIVKYSAQYNSEGNISRIRSVFTAGVLFELILGSALTIISFLLSGVLAQLFQRPEIIGLIQISSIYVLSGALVATATAAFTGLERMHLNSVMLIIQAIVKTGLMLLLIIAGLGTLGAVIGFSVGFLVAGITGILLAYTIYRSLPKTPGKLELSETTKTMLRYGFPVSIGAILSGFLTYFYTYIMAYFVTDNAAIGNFSVAQNFVVLITFFATPVTTMLFPAFSKLDPEKEGDTLKNVFQYSVKYASLIVIPVTILVMALAQPAIETLFQGKYTLAPLYLVLLSITYLYTALGNLSVSNLITGQGYTKYGLKLTILAVAVGFPLSFFFTSQYGIVGLIIGTALTSVPGMILSLRFVKRQFNVTIDWVSSSKILFASASSGLLTYLSVIIVPVNPLIQLIIGVILFVIIFVLVAVLTRTINRLDLANIREIAKALGPLKKIINPIVTLIEKIMIKLSL